MDGPLAGISAILYEDWNSVDPDISVSVMFETQDATHTAVYWNKGSRKWVW